MSCSVFTKQKGNAPAAQEELMRIKTEKRRKAKLDDSGHVQTTKEPSQAGGPPIRKSKWYRQLIQTLLPVLERSPNRGADCTSDTPPPATGNPSEAQQGPGSRAGARATFPNSF